MDLDGFVIRASEQELSIMTESNCAYGSSMSFDHSWLGFPAEKSLYKTANNKKP
jgi:hypothetical protein